MAKPKKVVLAYNMCADCWVHKKQKVIMTVRGGDTLECPKCNCWKPKEAETVEQKRARLEAELKALG